VVAEVEAPAPPFDGGPVEGLADRLDPERRLGAQVAGAVGGVAAEHVLGGDADEAGRDARSGGHGEDQEGRYRRDEREGGAATHQATIGPPSRCRQ
jgi:hypothetical protein